MAQGEPLLREIAEILGSSAFLNKSLRIETVCEVFWVFPFWTVNVAKCPEYRKVFQKNRQFIDNGQCGSTQVAQEDALLRR